MCWSGARAIRRFQPVETGPCADTGSTGAWPVEAERHGGQNNGQQLQTYAGTVITARWPGKVVGCAC
jgi:hypothetical protein